MPTSQGMSEFQLQLAAAQPKAAKSKKRTWLYLAYDQLTDRTGPLAALAPSDAGIVLIECAAKAQRRPYHKQKLAWLLSNQRHFALEQAQRGVAVRYEFAAIDYATTLTQLVGELGPLTMMEAAERELRHELAPLADAGQLRVVPHTGWLTTAAEFQSFCGTAPWRMDAFYRGARRARDILMEGTGPVGGKFSFDAENRQPYRGKPAAPQPLRFVADAITNEVCSMVAATFADHPGELRPDTIAATDRDARAAWRWALTEALPHFGPFEDAMSTQSSTLFHTLISPLLNLHRLLPAEVINDAIMAPIDMASKEGFIRQILGWREFVRHVHVQTDGFRNLEGGLVNAPSKPAVKAKPATKAAPAKKNSSKADGRANDLSGDAGYGRYVGAARPPLPADLRGVAPAQAAVANYDVPAVFWGAKSGLNCLDSVVADVWRTGYSHHITRLMVLGNIATLLDVSPRQLTDWFWIAYIDAYDWVVEPNVLGMATFGLGDLMTTKPYVAGSAYIDRMSDYCKGCQFAAKTTCPLTPMYWAYLDRHSAQLADNPRMFLPMASLRKRTPAQRASAAATFDHVTHTLQRGEKLGVPTDPKRK